ncbi:enoyl-CoA hydratase [Rhizobium subbaraonis]|uniref:Enoyl-CoA hydratase n=1 Tax=Rhizobium subbaraonis TaxID=908946 RepID=A0A285UW32_9HYPH|nr:enoyl-CoA hydratase/isomerase family protein [Rhizobium subbaraonis]SOC46030.1 enoyl-CoA hydratase [Rhizobium subbaraonis]
MTVVSIEREGPLALVRYDRGSKANALNMEAIEALTAAADELAADTGVQIVVLTGTEARFSAGVDLDDDRLWRKDADPVVRSRAMSAGGRMCERWLRLPQVTIAALEGAVIGGGAILALTADFRIAGEGAYFRFPEVKLGMTLGWGGLPLLSNLIGATRAKRALFTDQRIEAEEALSIGLCDEFAVKGGAVDAARALGDTIALCPPAALRMTKRSIDANLRANWAAGFEQDQFFLSRTLTEQGG